MNRKDRPTVDGVSECCSHHGVVFRDVSTAGDRMLQQVVDAIRGVLRSFDLIIRYGGDEFICAFPGITMADVTKRVATINAPLLRGQRARIRHGGVRRVGNRRLAR